MKFSPFIKDLLLKGREENVFSVAAASVIWGDEVFFATVSDEKLISVTPETLFDVASLTKPLVTASLIFQPILEKKLSLSTTLGEIVEDSRETLWENTTVLQLLNHSSGLPSYRFYFLNFINKGGRLEKGDKSKCNRLVRMILDERMEYQPGSRSSYSDFGYILLGKVVEKVYSATLESAWMGWKERFDLDGMIFNPPDGKYIPPTEILGYRGPVRGEVHDEHAFICGGVAGHAGLFASLKSISRYVADFMKNFSGEDIFFPSSFLREILSLRIENSTWLPGWDTPSPRRSQAGEKAGRNVIGHLGYTGCSIWMDLDKWVAGILLTNRTFPTRFNQKIKFYRPYFYDKIWESNLKNFL